MGRRSAAADEGGATIIKNAWLKMGFKWFDKQEGEGVLGVLGGVEGIV